ncbi:MAG: type II and III secretion system protein family protein [bacterium]
MTPHSNPPAARVLAAWIAVPASFAAASTTDLPSTVQVGASKDGGAPIALVAGSSSLHAMPARIERVIVVDPKIVDANPVSDREVVFIARAAGTTDVVCRLEDGTSVTKRVTVTVDTRSLASSLRGLFGIELDVEDVDGTLALRGTMPNIATAERVREFMDRTGLRYVDVTRLAGVQQVQLRVRIAEASRTALRELAFGGVFGGSSVFGGIQSPGGTPFQPVSIAPFPGAPVSDANFAFGREPVSSATTLFGGVVGSDLEVYLQALDENRYIRLLAEPNLVAVSGEEATFLVGGEFPIPVVQGTQSGGGSTVTIEYKEFGVRLNFRPEVLGDGRIRLEVAPEVSELSQIGALNQNGFTVPSVVTRRSSTTVELGNGQSFAMAGLLKSNDQARVSRVPVLGDIPGLGALFRSVRYEQDQTELVVMVTAELVEPLSDGLARPMPGDLHVTPNDWELFVEGSTSGAVAASSPVARLKSFGLDGLRGPGAWRRSDDERVSAADAMATPAQSASSTASPTANPANGTTAAATPSAEPALDSSNTETTATAGATERSADGQH